MLYKEIPFLLFTPALVIGILLSELFHSNLLLLLITAIVTLLVILAIGQNRKYATNLFGLPVTAFIILTGLTLGNFRKSSIMTIQEEMTEITIRALDYPEEREKTVRVPARILQLNGKMVRSRPNNMMLYIYSGSYSEKIIPGDIIIVSCKPQIISDFDSSDNFDYSLYMLRQGYRFNAFTGMYKVETPRLRGLKAGAIIMSKKLASVYSNNGISGDRLALASAITLGQKDMLTPGIEESFSRTGIMHLLAVSGLHVGILSYFFMSLLSFLKRRANLLRILMVLIVIWIFAFITGLSPPVTRAATMFSLLHLGQTIKRPANNLNIVLASAFIMLVINPALILNAGFQLSYSAVLTIILFYNDIRKLLIFKSSLLKWAWQLTVVSFLAQAGTLPFVLYYFQKIPLFSLAVNLVAIPLAFLILTSGFMLLFCSMVPILSNIFSSLFSLFLGFLLGTAEDIANLPFSSLSTGNIDLVTLLLLLFSIPVILAFLFKEKRVHPHLALVTVIILVVLAF